MMRRALLVLAALVGSSPAGAESPGGVPPTRVEMAFADALARSETS